MIALAGLMLLLASAPLTAQPSDRPFRGLFGGNNPPGASNNLLTFIGMLFSAYDEGIGAGSTLALDRYSRADGAFSGTDLTLLFTPRGRKLTLAASASSAIRYYQNTQDLLPASHSARANVQIPLRRRTSVSVHAAASYLPYFALAAVDAPTSAAAEGAAPARDYAFANRRVVSYDGGLGIEQGLGQRTTLSIRQGYHYSEPVNEPGISRVVSAGANLATRIRPNLGVGARYGFSSSISELGSPTRVHDVGLNVNREWRRSPTRRTAFSLSVGSALSQHDSEQTLLATGAVSLDHQLGRSWAGRAEYRRGVSFLEGTGQPVAVDTATVGLSGMLSRRLQVHVAAAAAHGEMGVVRSGGAYDSATGMLGVQFALSPSLALYADYVHLYYRSEGVLPQGYPAEQSRRGVRVGLTVNVPLLTQEQPRAPR